VELLLTGAIIAIAIVVFLFLHWLSDGDTTVGLLKLIVRAIRFVGLCFGITILKTKEEVMRDSRISGDVKVKNSRGSINIGGVIILLIIAVIFGWFLMVAQVPAGSVGIKDSFGNVDDDVLQPGLHLKLPWTMVVPMSVQTQLYYDYFGKSDVATIVGLSNEGLSVTMGISANYRMNPSKAVEVYKRVGKEYQNTILVNPIHSVPRDLISKYEVKTLYSAGQAGSPDRLKIESELTNGIQTSVDNVGVKDSITIEQVYIRTIDPPEVIKNAIASKLKSEQERDQERFEVQKMEITAEKMRVEGKGIADRNKEISDSLTPQYIAWYTVEMMKSRTGDTYFIPVDQSGKPNPQLVIPVATGVSGS